jgi:hypothetical protein
MPKWIPRKCKQIVEWNKEDNAGHDRVIQKRYRHSERNKIEILEIKYSINHVKSTVGRQNIRAWRQG